MHAELEGLKATVREGFANILRVSDERHRENRERLVRIEDKQDKTNGNVTRHEEQITTLFKRTKDAPDEAVTQKTLAFWWSLIAGAAVLTYWAMRTLLGFHQ